MQPACATILITFFRHTVDTLRNIRCFRIYIYMSLLVQETLLRNLTSDVEAY